MYLLPQKHFDSSQYEKNRADGIVKLKPNAIPTIFDYLSTKKMEKLQNPRRSPRKRSAQSPPKNVAKKLQFAGPQIEIPSTSTSSDQIASPASLDESQSPSNSSDITDLKWKIHSLEYRLQSEKALTSKLKQQIATKDSNISFMFNADQLEKLGRKTTRGCKWSDDSIKKGLKLRFACGTTGYELLLSEKMPLPSIRTLNRHMEHITLEPGIQKEVFDFLKLKVSNLNIKEKECCLTLDEMAIQPGVQFDRSSSRLCGEVTLPDHSGNATHALVFMLSGVSTRWKQTVAYHFTGDSVRGEAMMPIINEIISLSASIGLHVVCVTSDMGSSNRAMHKAFGISCSKSSQTTGTTINKIQHPFCQDRFLHFMFDVPHLKSSIVSGSIITLRL